MRLIGRLFLLFVACALAAWAVWTFALDRSDMRRDLFARAAENQFENAAPKPIDAQVFRATACPEAACVLVEAGGLAFLSGGGAGVTDALFETGLLRTNLDGVLLSGVAPSDTSGLVELASALAAAGRANPLPVYGPAGVGGVIDGANRMLRPEGFAEGAVLPLIAGGAAENAADASIVFDSGVVQVRSWPAGAHSIYRVDFDARSLILAGCGVAAEDVRNAARGAERAAAVIAASSAWMIETQQQAAADAGLRRARAGVFDPSSCLTGESALTAARDARLSGLMLAPLWPVPTGPAERIWRDAVESPADLPVVIGLGGARIDVARAGPSPPG